MKQFLIFMMHIRFLKNHFYSVCLFCMLPEEEIMFVTAKTLLGNSAGWTEHLNNTNINTGTTELLAKMYMCQMSFVNIQKPKLPFELFLYECLPNPKFPLCKDRKTVT